MSIQRRLVFALGVLGAAACQIALAETPAASTVQPKVHLRAGAVDLLQPGPRGAALVPEGSPIALRTAPGGSVVLVQFHKQPLREWQQELKDLGVELIDYVPDFAFLARLSAGVSRTAVQALPYVRAVSDFEPGLKISREVTPKLDDSASAPARLRVWLLPSVDPDEAGAELRRRFPSVSVTYVFRHRHRSSLTLDVPADAVRALVGSVVRSAWSQLVEVEPDWFPLNDNAAWIGQSYDRNFGPGEAQAAQLPKEFSVSGTIWNRGLLGQNQIVGVADVELEPTLCQFYDPNVPLAPQTVMAPNPVVVNSAHRKVIAWNAPANPLNIGDTDWLQHGSHTSGSAVGDDLTHLAGVDPFHADQNDGMAPAAKLFFADIGGNTPDCKGAVGPGSLHDLFTQMYTAGVRISSNSYGTAVNTPSDFGLESMVWEHPDFLIFFAAGNFGNQTVTSAAANKSVIAVGGSQTYQPCTPPCTPLDPENMASGSSVGPTSDGRLKPDLAAPGYSVSSAKYPTTPIFSNNPDFATLCSPADPDVCTTSFGCYRRDTSSTCSTHALPGTSMACPVAAGLGALARQYFADGFYPSGQANPPDARTPSAALLKAVMINGARNMTGANGTSGPLADAPSNKQGWGRVMLDDALYFTGDPRRLWVEDVPLAEGPATGENWSLQVKGTATGQPFKATLVWTDPPVAGPASIALVNDLDLVVTAPDGTTYRGNQWTADNINVPGDKFSASNPSSRDSLNNVEGILIPSTQVGGYRIEVRGVNVPGYDDVYRQGFALVVTGAVESCAASPGPTGLQADKRNPTDVQLTWQPVAGATGYRIYRHTSACPSAPLGDFIDQVSAGGPAIYLDDTTQSNATYYYTIRAVLGDGCETLDSNCDSVVIPAGPALTAVSPASATNNNPTPVSLTGTGFVAGARVFLGTDANPQKYQLAPVTFVSSTKLEVIVPVNLQDGIYDVLVINPDLQEAALANAFRVTSPVQVRRIYVPEFGLLGQSNYRLMVVDIDAFTTSTVNLGPLTRPRDIAVSPVNKLGVMQHFYGKLGVFDAVTNQVQQTINNTPGMAVAIHPNGQIAYALERGTPHGTLRVRDLATNQPVTEFSVGGEWVGDLELSPDGRHLYVSDVFEDTILILDTTTYAEIAALPVGSCAEDMQPSNDNTRLYVANYCSDTITVLDTVNLTVLATWNVAAGPFERRPWSLAISDDDALLYVGFNSTDNATQGDMVKIATSTGTVQTTITHNLTWRDLKFLSGKVYGLSTEGDIHELNSVTLVPLRVADLNLSVDRGFGWLYTKPIAITQVSPAGGCAGGGTTVQITGEAFQGEVRNDSGAVVQQPTRVFFGGTEVLGARLLNAQSLEVSAPPHAAGTVAVMVLNPDGTSATLASAYVYGGSCPAPTVTAVTPGTGINNDPTPLTITGTNFVPGAQAYLGTEAVPKQYALSSPTFVHATKLQATVPVNLLNGTYDVLVVNPDLQSGSLNDSFRMRSPAQVPKIYVPEFATLGLSNYRLQAVNLDTFAMENVNLGANTRPRDIAVSQASKLGAMPYFHSTALALLDPLTNQVIRTTPESTGIAVAIHPDGRTVYILQRNFSDGTIFVRDLVTDQLVTQFNAGDAWVDDLEVSPDGRHLYLSNLADNTISVLDTTTYVEIAELPVGPCGSYSPQDMQPSNDNTRLYVANYCTDTITVLDTVNLTVLATWNVATGTGQRRPWSLAIADDDLLLYVGLNSSSSATQGDMIKIATATGTVQTTITHNLKWKDLEFLNGKLYGLSAAYSDVHELDAATLQLLRLSDLNLSVGRGFGSLNIEPLAITQVSPTQGCTVGGTVVQVTGNGFQGKILDGAMVVQAGTQVIFGGVASTTVTLINSHTLQAVAPAHSAGLVDVKVSNPNGKVATLPSSFTYTVCPR